VRIFLTEKAFPEEAAAIKLESRATSSFVRCNVFETRVDIAENDRGSTLIQIGRAFGENI
jgi:hypothetical protein